MSAEAKVGVDHAPAGEEPGALFAGRYALQGGLGEGGMADVALAHDRVTGRHVALKRLRQRAQSKNTEFSIRMFEREFQVLSELAHPRVVEAYDYGVADGLPYYSMELLDGGDLHGLSPMPVERVCRVFRDIASVLALLHSRRLVYRDLNPRNIRCTSEGAAKLIDFGAMTLMGPTRKIIGTPGFVAPEVVHQQHVDGRADLYVLGCAMYFALTGRPPFVARDFAQLKVAWAAELAPPSRHDAGIPAAMDELVTDLLQLDPAFRPGSAAEVMDRLGAIADLPDDEQLQVSGAYLVAPPLIGRTQTLQRIRRQLAHAHDGAGRTVLLQGASGVGRTRMLEAVVLEAKLAGAVAASADSADAQKGDYGVADWLGTQVLDAVPEALELARKTAPVIGHALSGLRKSMPDLVLQKFGDPRDRRPALQAGLREWFVAVSEVRPFVVAVDDIDRIDEPSLALLALLAAVIDHRSVCIVLTQTQDDDETVAPALSVLRDRARIMNLPALSKGDTQSLLSAMFGESAQLPLVTDRLHEAARGNARNLMQLAEFLVDNEIVRYQRGQWVLPQQLAQADLPRSAEDALARVLDGLSPAAQRLASSFAVSTREGLSFEDCLGLDPQLDQRGVLRAFAELTAADVLQVAGDLYSFSRTAWAPLLRSRLSEVDLADRHCALAQMMERRGYSQLLQVHHLQHGGRNTQALDLMVAFCAASVLHTASDTEAFHELVDSLPANWYTLFDWAVREAELQNRPRKDGHMVRFRLSGLIGLSMETNAEHLEAFMAQLQHDVGLDLYQELQTSVPDPGERLKQALEGAQARHEAAPDDVRVFSPLEALRPLAQAEITAASMVVIAFDYRLLGRVPSLRPVEPLSSSLLIVQRLLEGLTYRMQGRSQLAEATYLDILERLDAPDHGVDPTHAKYLRLGVVKGLGMIETAMGLDRALSRADALAGSPLLVVGGSLIRMLHHYYQSQPKEGDALKRAHVLLGIESSGLQWFEGTHLPPEIVAHCLARDLPRLKDLLAELHSCAGDRPGWRPIVLYAKGEYHRLRGDLAQAETLLFEALSLCKAGEHQVWPNVAGAYVSTLVARGQVQRAVDLAAEYRLAAQRAQQGINELFILVPEIMALAASGRLTAARQQADAIIAELLDTKVTGLLLGVAYEASARVAIAEGDRTAALALVTECRRHFRADTNRSGHARCERLRRELDVTVSENSALVAPNAELSALHSELRSRIAETMQGCAGNEQCQRRTLEFLLAQSTALGGALFMAVDGELSLAAKINVPGADDALRALAARHMLVLADGGDDDDMCTQTEIADEDAEGGADGGLDGQYRVVLLGHREQGLYLLTAIAVLIPDGQQALSYPQLVPELLSRQLAAVGFVATSLTEM